MGRLGVGVCVAASCAAAACSGGGSNPQAAIAVTPSAVSFAAQQLGSTSAATLVTVSNDGSAGLTVSGTQLSGADAAAFSAASSCGTVAAGGYCTIAVRFKPTASGTAAATLSVGSNASTTAVTVALTGQGTAAATWSGLTNSPAEAVQLCLLLTDASLMCQANQNWYRLTPSDSGSYVEGSWSLYTSFPAGYVPQAYASAVLADGRVAIMGGEYLEVNGKQNFTLSNMGMIFNPVTRTWTALAPPPTTGTPNHWQCIGDAPAVVLADGRWAIGSKLYQDVAVLDPATLAWSQLSAPGKSDTFNSEEGWTLLPDGSVLTLDVAKAPAAERLVLSSGATSGTWTAAGPTPGDLHTPSTSAPLSAPGCPVYHPPGEMGPALLLPDGDVFAIGADGLTGIYSSASNTWAAGPVVPNGLNIEDGPAAMLPSGHVLFGASPGDTGLGLQYYEFDGTQLASAPAPANAANDATFFTSLLPLPTGQVLFVDGTTIQIYSPALSQHYAPAWAPTISAVATALSAGSTYQIMGTQFNGLTQASAYGDESENATNYPLVRITNNATGHVVYARTHGHSTMAVATGSAVVSTDFDVPMAIESGASTLQVIANGIPSAGMAVTVSGGTAAAQDAKR